VDYTIRSSPSNPVPTSFTGSNPIHIQLENDPSGNKKYVDISLSKQIVLSGLSIQTIEKMALGSFTISYLDRSIEYPGSMKTFTRLQNNDQQVNILTQAKYYLSEIKIKCVNIFCVH
jgi:hypothetical protein